MHDESLEPRAYARLHADRYLWQEQQERAAANLDAAARHEAKAKNVGRAEYYVLLGVVFLLGLSGAARHFGWIG